jgi:membrane protease YdiL (CAAX protease family)
VIALVAAAIESALTGAAPTTWLSLRPEVIGLVGGLVVGPLGEELGWRGFALPRLQERYGALIASVLIGITWALWHNWPIVTGEPFDFGGIATSGVRLVALSILIAFLYNATHGALPVAMCAHAGYNLANQLVARPDVDVLRGPVELAIYVVLAVGVTVLLATRQAASSNKQIPPFA